MSHKTTDPAMAACIEACIECHKTCLHHAMMHCLEEGGKHTEPHHIRLMLNCAEICQTSANFLLSGSDFHHLTCGVCSEICQACAGSCERIEGMENCAAVCRNCAALCSGMAG